MTEPTEQFEGLGSMNQPKLETLDYEPEQLICKRCQILNCGCKAVLMKETIEQPNTNAMIIKTIQNLMHVITNNLEKLPDEPLRRMALDDIGVFEAGLLYKLQEEYT